MDVYELFRARIENRFGIKHYIATWIISARIFAIPWIALFTLFGALLAGIESVERAIAAMTITSLILLAGHFNNNYKDVETGVDKYVSSIEEAEKICSTIKPYTAAAWIVPLRITSIRFHKVSEMALIAIALVIYAYFYSSNIEIALISLPMLIAGIILARTYTTHFKPKKRGEVCLFLSHGFGPTVFGFLSQKSDIIMAMLAGIPPGLISGLVYSVDQFIDIKTDFVSRVRSIYESWFNSRMPLSLYVLIIFSFWLYVVLAWIVAEIYPKGTLIVLLLLPLVLFFAPQLEFNRNSALVKIVLIATFLVPLLFCVGVLI